jgi:hypothetical protein
MSLKESDSGKPWAHQSLRAGYRERARQKSPRGPPFMWTSYRSRRGRRPPRCGCGGHSSAGRPRVRWRRRACRGAPRRRAAPAHRSLEKETESADDQRTGPSPEHDPVGRPNAEGEHAEVVGARMCRRRRFGPHPDRRSSYRCCGRCSAGGAATLPPSRWQRGASCRCSPGRQARDHPGALQTDQARSVWIDAAHRLLGPTGSISPCRRQPTRASQVCGRATSGSSPVVVAALGTPDAQPSNQRAEEAASSTTEEARRSGPWKRFRR